MTDTTTIEITVKQKATLDALKTSDGEAYKGVLQRLIDNYEDSGALDRGTVRDIANEQIDRRVRLEALDR